MIKTTDNGLKNKGYERDIQGRVLQEGERDSEQELHRLLEGDLGEVCISRISYELSYVHCDYAWWKKKLREKKVVRFD